MEFITLTRDDPEFDSYLLGTFSKDHRALPVETYQPQTKRERVTFRVLPLEKVAPPQWWKSYLLATRPELWALTLGPAMAAWLNHKNSLGQWTQWPSWLALVGIFFLHTAVFLLNDVEDHVRGFDRQNRQRGSRLIQKGWVRAIDMKRWVWVNAALAVVFGAPAFLNAPIALAVVCGLAALSIVFLARKIGVRQGLNDLAIYSLFGPLLTAGISLASFGEWGARDATLGLAFGSLTLWVFQLRHFENQFRSNPESARTFLGWRSFDEVRWICAVEAGLILVLQPLVAFALDVPIIFLALAPLVSVPLIFTVQRFFKAASPLSSSLVHTSKWALGSHLAWTLWWILALGVPWL